MTARARPQGAIHALILVCAFLNGSHFLAASEENQLPTLRLVAYNIKHGRGMDNKVDLQRVAAVLKRLEPDLVALQEIDRTCTRSGKVDQAATLGKLLGMHHRFGEFMEFQGGHYGLAVLSRLPVVEVTRHQLAPGAEPRCALEVIVRPAQSAPLLSFVSIHNDWTDERFRLAQVNGLIKGLADRKNPIVLAGDFNATPGADSLARLTDAGFTILGKEGNGKTFPSPAPRIEIDYFATRGVSYRVPALTRVHDERVASDHRPILMDLQLALPRPSGQ